MDLLSIRADEPRTFALRGELDMASADELMEQIRGAPPEGDLTLDLSELTFMDSSGLRAFLEAASTRSNGSCVVLKDPSEPVAHVLEIAVPGGGPGLRIEWSDGGPRDGSRTHDAR